MCEEASFIIPNRTSKVLWSKTSDSHTQIAEEHYLHADGVRGCNYTNFEITPKDKNFLLPLDEWDFKVDEEEIPIWLDVKEAERLVRLELVNWMKAKIVLPNETRQEVKDNELVIACYGRVERISGSGRVGSISGSGSVGRISGSGRVGSISDSGSVGRISDSGSVGRISGSGRVESILGSGRVGSIYDSGRVGIISGSGRVGSISDSGRVGSIYDSGSVGSIEDEANITTYIKLDIKPKGQAVIIDRSGDEVKCITAKT